MENRTTTEMAALMKKLSLTNSRNEKTKILKEVKSPNLLKLLDWTFDKTVTFGVTSQGVGLFNKPVPPLEIDDILVLLQKLKDRELTGDLAVSTCRGFFMRHPDNHVLMSILDKDLGVGVSTATANAALDDEIFRFQVALGYDIVKVDDEILNEGTWYVSRKLDGNRCILAHGTEKIFYARSGNKKDNLENLKKIINLPEGLVLDGELCRIKPNGDEDFRCMNGEFHQKEQIQLETANGRLVYRVFDIIDYNRFWEGYSCIDFSERQQILKDIVKEMNCPYVEMLEQKEYVGVIGDIKDGQEGWIVRKDAPYQGKRSKDILKVKKCFDEELTCTGVEMTNKDMLDCGLMVSKPCIGALLLDYNGTKVRVGSGLSNDDRLKDPKDFIGHNIKFSYTEKSQDKKGTENFRHSRFVCIRDIID
jgi:DNA ligase-1